MFQHIMVPLDGSALAERALPWAERLASESDADIHLVRVTEIPPAMPVWAPMPPLLPEDVFRDLLETETKAATTYLQTTRDRLVGAGIRAETDHLTGNPAASLLDYEETRRIDLVVMCSHGRSGLARFTLGSVAERLLRHGGAPVLLVRAFGEAIDLDHALVPLDGSTRAEEALRVLGHLARRFVGEVTLLRVVHDQQQGVEAERYLGEIAGLLRQEGLTCRRQVEQGDPAQVILDVAGHRTLVVMATHGRTGAARWALGSVADRVTHGGAEAVLLVRSTPH